MSTLSTHVLDTSLGRPARGIAITLERAGENIGGGVTDADGRVRELAASAELEAGTYRLVFHVGDYFARDGRESFYADITIEFRVAGGEEHYHVPLLLSPFGYATYRGS